MPVNSQSRRAKVMGTRAMGPLSGNENANATLVAAGRDVIRTEAQALFDLADSLNNDFAKVVGLFYALSGRVVVTGMGKSGHIARKIAATLASTGSQPYSFTRPRRVMEILA